MSVSFECRHCGARVVAHHVSEAPVSRCPHCRGPLRLVGVDKAAKEAAPDVRAGTAARFVLNGKGLAS